MPNFEINPETKSTIKQYAEYVFVGAIALALILFTFNSLTIGGKAWDNTFESSAKLEKLYNAHTGTEGQERFYGLFEVVQDGTTYHIEKNIGTHFYHTASIGSTYNMSFGYYSNGAPAHPDFESAGKMGMWQFNFVLGQMIKWCLILIGAVIVIAMGKEKWEKL